MRAQLTASLSVVLVAVGVGAALLGVYFLADSTDSGVSNQVRIDPAPTADLQQAEETKAQLVAIEPAQQVPAEAATLVTAQVGERATSDYRERDRVLAWARETEQLRPAELRELAAKEESSLNAAAAQELKTRYELGIYEVVGSGTRRKITKEERAQMGDLFTCLTMPSISGPNLEQHKTVLPRAEYPELYEMKVRIAWLREQAVLRSPKR